MLPAPAAICGARYEGPDHERCRGEDSHAGHEDSKVKEHIGAIVTGMDLAHPIDGATQKKLYDAVVENVVLVIRGQEHLTPRQLQAAGEMFGELMEDQNRRYLVDGFPLISVLDNRHKDSKGQPAKVGANATWHTDHTNLYAVAVPDKGGATSVCNARAAYEALPDDVKLKIANAKTENTLISSARMKTGNPDVVKAQLESTKPPTVHPLVRTHPDTGTKAVWFIRARPRRSLACHRRNSGFSAGFDRYDHAATILLCARV
jgi:taurine dioxygenase